MTTPHLEAFALRQIEIIEQDFKELDAARQYDDFSNIKDGRASAFNSSCIAFLHRTVGSTNPYFTEAQKLINKYGIQDARPIPYLIGIVQAVKRDISNGYLKTIEALVHAGVFSDFVEMADHHIATGYKDSAAVLLGGVLESHIRKLAVLNGIALDDVKNGSPVPRGTEMLNQDLGKAAYGMLEQKQVTAWLALRNKAAHGKYSEYQAAQVELFSDGLKGFLLRHPA